MQQIDWLDWHAPYEDGRSPLSRRLGCVRAHVGAWLDAADRTGARVLSVCAGQGRDLLPEMAIRPELRRLRACLVERDLRNAAVAERAAAGAGLAGVEVRRLDAGRLESYAGAVPADLILLCGVFGNTSDADVRRTVRALPGLCSPDAEVIWTRSRRPPDLTPAIRGWLGDAGFAERAFDAPERDLFSVGVHRLAEAPRRLTTGGRIFRFVT